MIFLLFKFYFLKQGTRVFDRIELITLLSNYKYIDMNDDGIIKRAKYHNPILNFDACFVLSNKCNIENINQLNPKYLDTNFYVEFDLLTNTYKISRLLDLVKEICHKFDFSIYNEMFEDVHEFDKSMCINAFKMAKNVYQTKYEDEFVGKPKMSLDLFDKVYSFLEIKNQVEETEENHSMNYIFLKEDTTRSTYLGIDFNLSDGTIIPPGAQLIKIHTSSDEYYIASFDQVYKKISKYCETVYTTLPYNILYIPDKNIRKINKILTKIVFDRTLVPLYEVEFDSILDF